MLFAFSGYNVKSSRVGIAMTMFSAKQACPSSTSREMKGRESAMVLVSWMIFCRKTFMYR